MKFVFITLFPELIAGAASVSFLGRAQKEGLIEVLCVNPRDYATDRHRSVDDTTCGGGAGMVMKPEVWAECLDDLLGLAPAVIAPDAVSSDAHDDDSASVSPSGAVNSAEAADTTDAADSGHAGNPTDAAASVTSIVSDTTSDTSEAGGNAAPVLIFPNPSAPLFTQRDATELSHADHLLFGCGRYEGYDARIPQYYRAQGVDVREYSIGDYVLNGGEVAVSVMLEAITRLLPGFMGNAASIVEESYTGENALLEHRQYTKPADWRGIKVPDVLLSGDHAKVDRFRRDEALAKTNELRPDLIEALDCSKLDKADRKTLMALGWEVSGAHPRQR